MTEPQVCDCDEAAASSVPQQHQSHRFRFLKQFNEPLFAKKTSCRDRLRQSDTRWFPGDSLSAAFARALCQHRAMPFKEVLESFEFFACARRRIRSNNVADLCCGHGLVGVLFAMFERHVEQVVLLDRERPGSFDRVVAAAADVAPWTAEKLRYIVSPLKAASRYLEPGAAIAGVHACGSRTDQCIDLAIQTGGPIAVLPCCRQHRTQPSLPALKQEFGADVAIDIERTYRLHNAGYYVRWDHVSDAITRMNRVLIATRPAE